MPIRTATLNACRPAVCALLFLIATLAPFAAAAEYQRVPGTSISLAVPEGFVYSQEVKGFYREDADSAIRVTQSSAPYFDLSGKVNPARLRLGGIDFVEQDVASASGMPARLISATRMKGDRKFREWVLVFGDEQRSAMVSAVYPENAAEVLSDSLRTALLSARWDTEYESGRFEGLSFRIVETPVMKIATRIPSGLVLTDGGATDSLEVGSPLLLINEVATIVEAKELEAYAMERKEGAQRSSELENVKGKKLEINGFPAYEYEADLRMLATGTLLRHYRAVVAGPSATYVFQGTVAPERGPEYIPQFRDIAHSLTRPAVAGK